ncbi:hypothetical protein M8C13_39275 [Crossiella sp. SN42]|uniref:hypothetical protein n=1 Tax=Crossiella sp. SN42 TaxID=2944808 RepID=UPI00207C70A4|nr:hypothetical protein [Crossiella sp. SN42]MCO1581808.1 hypothetical protein [Crossiella sp. SN42]
MGRRIGGAGGGSDPAGKGGAVVVAAVAVVALAGAAGAGGGLGLGGAGGAGGGSGGGAANSAASRNISARKSEGKKSAKSGKAEQAWQRLGTRQLRKEVRTAAECLSHSFGRVREFFAHTPCKSLDRALFSIGDGEGNVVVVSVVWVRFRSRGQAEDFRRLSDVHGSGDITPLAAELLELRDIRFTGRNYDAQPNGNAVVIAETETAAGSLSAEALDAVAEVAAQLPHP